MKLFRLFALASFILLVSACASLDAGSSRSQQSQQARVVLPSPVVPEIKPARVIRPYAYSGAKVIKRPPAIVRPRYQAPKHKAPKVQRYPGAPSRQVNPSVTSTPPQTMPVVTPIVKKEVKTSLEPEDEGLDIDPYANIPENADGSGTGRQAIKASSPAVEALLVRAYADAKLGRTDAAMSKLERGLRIEPQNPKLWNQLAELHYKSGNYQQAITMAKKAINFSSSNKQMKDKNWQLISKVAKKSGDSRAMSEVNDYNKRR
ncbi:MAG TPA: tetratricopeptide repeat protein [Leucothrix mucor]|nr:tetratricopeptide repeat protein [Leucothrix mucor]